MRLTMTNLYEAAYLQCLGMSLADVWLDRGQNAATVVFAFEGNGELTKLQKAFHTGTATVNLAAYRRSLTAIKDIMFELIRKETREPRTRRNVDHASYHSGTAQPC